MMAAFWLFRECRSCDVLESKHVERHLRTKQTLLRGETFVRLDDSETFCDYCNFRTNAFMDVNNLFRRRRMYYN